MLNLAQLSPQVKAMADHVADSLTTEPLASYIPQPGPVDAVRVAARKTTTARPADSAKMSVLYRALKQLGWQSTHQAHPIDKTAVLKLNNALIHRDPDAEPGYWVVEVAGGMIYRRGNLAELTAEVIALESAAVEPEMEPLPHPVEPMIQIAASLKAVYPHLGSRIEAALALALAGQVEFPQYKVTCELANGGTPNRGCNCSDAWHRGYRTDFGLACKHTIAQHIVWLAGREFNQVVQREIVDRTERRARFATDPAPGDGGVLAADFDGGPSAEYKRRVAQSQRQREEADARYAAALRPDPMNRRQQRGVEIKGIGHR